MQALYPSDDWEPSLRAFAYHYGRRSGAADQDDRYEAWLAGHANVTSRLPQPDRSPDLGDFLDHIARKLRLGRLLPAAEQMLSHAGL
jgi:hypothetical protein